MTATSLSSSTPAVASEVVPADVTRAVLAEELPPAQAWAARRGWSLAYEPARLTLAVQMTHPVDGSTLVLAGGFDSYRALPPLWTFIDPDTGAATKGAVPAPGTIHGQASIFHPEGFICAHWSRAAYAECGGPHGNWGAATSWAEVREGGQAHVVAEMLAAVAVHLEFSPGRLG